MTVLRNHAVALAKVASLSKSFPRHLSGRRRV
jgi:hypothetical protein